MDGHLRCYALREIGISEVECLVSTEDESFTYNARINRLSPIQEHAMITRAVKNGVAAERIASALDLDVKEIKSHLNMLRGIHEEAVVALRKRRVAFEVGARELVKQDFKFGVEKGFPTLGEMIKEGGFMFEQLVVALVEAVDLGQAKVAAEQVGHRAVFEPVPVKRHSLPGLLAAEADS